MTENAGKMKNPKKLFFRKGGRNVGIYSRNRVGGENYRKQNEFCLFRGADK